MERKQPLAPVERVETIILLVRGHKAMLDYDLAALYEVEVKVLNQAVKRNIERFPEDFMFRLTAKEAARLRSQTVTLERGRYRKYLPYAFTELGVAMLSSVLRSKRAVQVNIEIMRAFVRLRGILASHKDLARRLDSLEKRYDTQFKVVFDAIRQLMAPPPERPRPRIGFHSGPTLPAEAISPSPPAAWPSPPSFPPEAPAPVRRRGWSRGDSRASA